MFTGYCSYVSILQGLKGSSTAKEVMTGACDAIDALSFIGALTSSLVEVHLSLSFLAGLCRNVLVLDLLRWSLLCLWLVRNVAQCLGSLHTRDSVDSAGWMHNCQGWYCRCCGASPQLAWLWQRVPQLPHLGHVQRESRLFCAVQGLRRVLSIFLLCGSCALSPTRCGSCTS